MKIPKILWGFSGWRLPKLSQQTKICSVLALKSLLLPQLMSFWYVFRWRPEEPELVTGGGFFRKGVFKNFTKITKKHLCRRLGSLFNKDSGRGLQFYYKETSLWVFFCKFCEILKKTYFGNVCERLLLRVRSLRVSFRKVLGFYFVNECFPANLFFLRMSQQIKTCSK